ncbi:hypothetical protein [Solitalea koreensis]|uniref:Uncharacterized protein n=1 Tax=Solitalea koreensis TaxID=543615 RepID=A0A521DJC7_9SPHI|nr:hypothetical protein [Solitalea koreensis]SMO71708.1 hypothetical protein SAMN06265350_10743 [Solitalea koreensis]
MILLCQNELGEIFNDSSKACLQLVLNGKKTSLRICEFLLLRQRLNDTDWKGILLDTDPKDDFHRIGLSIKSKAVVFELHNALRLRDLTNTAYFYFSLKDMLSRSGVTMQHDLTIPSEEELVNC